MNNESTSSFPMTSNLKRSFECAVRDLYEVGSTGKVSSYRSPIGRRRSVAEPSANAEKRAMSDAARALAQLWKIAPHSR
jgi:hypothetical protein